jgi:hypothetical protein
MAQLNFSGFKVVGANSRIFLMVRKMSPKITLFLAVRGWPPKIPCYFHRPLLPKVMLFSLILFGWPLKIQNHRNL